VKKSYFPGDKRGMRSEIDYLNGLIVKRGEALLGIATQANRVLWALVKLMEGKLA
jgi:2-dehydropantoate 2-reductase